MIAIHFTYVMFSRHPVRHDQSPASIENKNLLLAGKELITHAQLSTDTKCLNFCPNHHIVGRESKPEALIFTKMTFCQPRNAKRMAHILSNSRSI